MPSLKQRGFSGGIVSPLLLSRDDQQKNADGLRACNNVIIRQFGSAENRPGTIYDDAVGIYQDAAPYNAGISYKISATTTYAGVVYVSLKDANMGITPPTDPSAWQAVAAQGAARIVRFVFDYQHSYELIFSRNQIAFYKAGVHISIPLASIAAWNIGTAYVVGNVVQQGGSAYVAFNPTTGADPTISPQTWNPLLSDGAGGYYLTIPVNSQSLALFLPEESLSTLQAVNENDIMTAVSQSFRPFQLTRFSDTAWTITLFTVAISIAPPTGVGATNGTAGAILFTYEVTAISGTDGAESLASATASCTGGTPTPANPNVISWTASAGAVSYRVYRVLNGIAGLVGITTLTTLSDQNVQPDYAQQPPVQLTNADGSALFSTRGNWPGAVCFYQQRLILANTVNQPTTFWASRVGSFVNFSISTPIGDSDALEVVVAGEESQPIVAMLDLQKLIIHTASAEYACTGNQSGTLTPSAVNCVLQGTSGARLPRPITIGNTDIFVQARGTKVRDLQFNIQSYTYRGKDLTVFSTQIFAGLTIVAMSWQQIADSVVWMAMSNGALYACTYVEEQAIWAWHTHGFANGFVEDVCVVPDATQDTVYLIVRRVINGVTVRYLEEFGQREYLDTVFYSDFVGTDCSLTYNGLFTMGVITSTVGGWTQSDLIAMDLSIEEANLFAASDVTNGSQVVLTLYDPISGLAIDRVTFSILTFVNAYQAKGYAQRAVPAWAQGTGIAGNVVTFGKAVTHFAGFSQLAGQSISVLADGEVQACPLEYAPVPNSSPPAQVRTYPDIIVANDGTFVIPKPALVVTAGLPVQWDAQTMPLENAQGETIMNKHITVKEVCPIVYFSRPAKCGQDQYHLLPMTFPKGPKPPPYQNGWPPAPYTGPIRQTVQGASQTTGQVWLRGVLPLPWGMSGVIITADIGDR